MTVPRVIREPDAFQAQMWKEKMAGRTIAVVPTMGALHEGHRQLLVAGRREADVLVATIFVNPTQFAPHEDFDAYPRTFEGDKAVCEKEGVHYIFAPTDTMMYPPEYATRVHVERLGEGLCGASRPHFFGGVATVCTKLFLITRADVAVFGWKDAQQQVIIRRLVRDLNLPVRIVGVETVREPEGLALSSRNQYLSNAERKDALVLSRALFAAREAVNAGERNAAKLRQGIVDRIGAESAARLDYVEVVSLVTLKPLEQIEPGNTLIALAAWWGETRLIDNVRV